MPLPELPFVICSHPAFDAAVHEQPLPVVTATVRPTMSSSPTVIEVGVIDGAQTGAAAAWLMVNVAPFTVTLADRAAPEFAAAVKPTDPLPAPPAVERVTHVACLVAVHWQPALVVTVNEPEPPVAAIEADTGCNVTVHGEGPGVGLGVGVGAGAGVGVGVGADAAA